MLLPSSCLRFGPPQNLTLTAGTNQTDQAQRVKELKKWVQQQDETLRALYWEEVEICSSALLLEEMEECFCETDWAAVNLEPGWNRSSPAHASSKRRRSIPAAAAPAKLGTPTVAPAEPSSPPPAAARTCLMCTPYCGQSFRRRGGSTLQHHSQLEVPSLPFSRLWLPLQGLQSYSRPLQGLLDLAMFRRGPWAGCLRFLA
ncbi:hypothetical protein CRENBAI_025344 [Crenichthys baileyi]|uniref:Uncharacterized protein n=1 Tax=Crenichthys baileyi TaxID=28760 RepID=A0AAV9RWC0_9TELE